MFWLHLLLAGGVFSSVVFGIPFAATNFDRIAVFFLWHCRLRLFPNAMHFADSVLQDPQSWAFHRYEITTQNVEIYCGSLPPRTLHVTIKGLQWEPNMIERRIIWNAVARRRDRVVSVAIRDLRNGR